MGLDGDVGIVHVGEIGERKGLAEITSVGNHVREVGTIRPGYGLRGPRRSGLGLVGVLPATAIGINVGELKRFVGVVSRVQVVMSQLEASEVNGSGRAIIPTITEIIIQMNGMGDRIDAELVSLGSRSASFDNGEHRIARRLRSLVNIQTFLVRIHSEGSGDRNGEFAINTLNCSRYK